MYLLFALVMAVLVVLQLYTGTAYGNMWREHTRAEQPGRYWFVIIVEAVAVIFFLVLARTPASA